MRFRAAVLTLLLVLPLSAAEPGPAAILQTASPSKLLTDIRAAANLVAGEMGSKSIDDGLKEFLGEKGFSGLDLSKPILGYMVYDEKDVEKTAIVLIVGITKEEDFLDLLERALVKPEAVADQKGVYKLGGFNLPQGADGKEQYMDVLMRLAGTTAYVGMNVPADRIDPAKVYKTEELFDPKETALVAFRQFNDRLPPKVIKNSTKTYEDMLAKMKEDFGGTEKAVFLAFEKLMQQVFKLNTEAKENGTRLKLDTTTGELTIDSYYVPKPGTEFAKAVAERKPTTNQFGSLANGSTAAAIMLQMPVGMKEMQELMISGIEAGEEEIQKNDPPPAEIKPLVDEVFKGLKRTVKSGNWDLAATLNGPDKDGHFTAGINMTFEDATPIEKTLREAIKGFPAPVRESFKLDVDKIGDLNVHAIDPPADGEPEGYSRLFGDRKIYLVFGPKGIYASVGNGSNESLKKAISAAPANANAFDVLVNPKKLSQAIRTAEPVNGGMAEKILGTDDKLLSTYTFSISGGEAMHVRFSMNLKTIPRWIALGMAVAE